MAIYFRIMNNQTISIKQELPENINFQKAYIVKYNQAKKVRQIRMLLTYLLALVVPPIVVANPGLKGMAGITGASWAIVALALSHFEKDLVKFAAKIQEEFDLSIFEMEHNRILVGDQIPPETIHNLANRFKGNPPIACMVIPPTFPMRMKFYYASEQMLYGIGDYERITSSWVLFYYFYFLSGD